MTKEKRAEVSDEWQRHIRPADSADRAVFAAADAAWSVEKPVAWRVRPSPAETVYFDGEEAAREFAVRSGTGARPLYLRQPQPTLTDAEREAVHQAAIRVEALCQRGSKHMAATLRGLLERTR